MRYRHWCLLLGLGLSLVPAPGCRKWFNWCCARKVQFTQVSGQEPVADEVSKLVVSNRVGAVRVVGDSPDALRVEAVVKLNEDLVAVTDKGTFADHVKVVVVGDTIEVQDAHTNQPDEKNWDVSMVLHVPARLAVKVSNGVGNISVEGTTSDLQLDSGVGDVAAEVETSAEVKVSSGVGDVRFVARFVSGALRASSGTGSVNVTLTAGAPAGDVVIESGVGDLRLALPADTPGSFSLNTGVGSITINGHEGLTVSQKPDGPSSSARGAIGTGGPNYTLKTGVGSIVVE